MAALFYFKLSNTLLRVFSNLSTSDRANGADTPPPGRGPSLSQISKKLQRQFDIPFTPLNVPEST